MSEAPVAQKRLLSLDAFRGFTIISMLLVNNKGADEAFHRQFEHAPWGQLVTFCDMIFPWFLFMVGVAIPFSAASFFAKNPGDRKSYFIKAAKRMFLLFLFGILVDSSWQRKFSFGMGVLQAIGLAYFAATLLYELPKRFYPWIIGILLVFYWALIRFVPIPGVGAGFFEENKNIIAYINRQYLQQFYARGILSVIPTAAMVLIGAMIGDLLRNPQKNNMQKLKTLGIAGVCLVIGAMIWNLSIPYNKPLWTPSYILLGAGWGCLVFGLFFYIIDMLNYQKWAMPCIVFGANAITAYFFSIMVREHTVKEWVIKAADGSKTTWWDAYLAFCQHSAGFILGSWLFTLSYIFVWCVFLYWMYRKKLFLRV